MHYSARCWANTLLEMVMILIFLIVSARPGSQPQRSNNKSLSAVVGALCAVRSRAPLLFHRVRAPHANAYGGECVARRHAWGGASAAARPQGSRHRLVDRRGKLTTPPPLPYHVSRAPRVFLVFLKFPWRATLHSPAILRPWLLPGPLPLHLHAVPAASMAQIPFLLPGTGAVMAMAQLSGHVLVSQSVARVALQ